MRIDTTLSSDEEKILKTLVEIKEAGGDVAEYVFNLDERSIDDANANYELGIIADLGDLGYIRCKQVGDVLEVEDVTALGRCYFIDKARRAAEVKLKQRKERAFSIFIVVLAAAMSILSGIASAISVRCFDVGNDHSLSEASDQDAEISIREPI